MKGTVKLRILAKFGDIGTNRDITKFDFISLLLPSGEKRFIALRE